jgi:hypothetical protein
VAFVTTIIFIAALAYFAYRMAVPFAAGKLADTFDLLATLLLAIIIGYTWLRSVKGYSLAAGEMVIDRAGPGKLRISLEDIKSAEAQPDLGSFMKTGPFSMQGLFGWSGPAEIRKPGELKSLQAQVYGTNPANTIVLQLADGRTVIVTPNDVAGFTGALHEAGVGSRPSFAEAPRPQYKAAARKKRK